MSKTLLFLLSASFSSLVSEGQNPYYSAKAIADSFVLKTTDSLQFNTTDAAKVRLAAHLWLNLPPGVLASPNNVDQVFSIYSKNPFIGKELGRLINLSSPPGFTGLTGFNLNGLFSQVGGVPITNFADGLAKFLVKRFKEELTITFFQKFKTRLDKVQELRVLFPSSYKVLLALDQDIYHFSIYLNTLRESFIKDLTNLYTDFKRLVELDKYRKYFLEDHPEAYTVIINSLYFIDQFALGEHPGRIIKRYEVDDLKFRDQGVQQNMRSGVKVLQALSTSFESSSPDHYWVPIDSIRQLLSDIKSLRLYFGLFYQRYGSIEFAKRHVADVQTESVLLSTILKNAWSSGTELNGNFQKFKNYVEEFGDHTQEIAEYLQSVKGKKKGEIDYNDYFKLFNASFDLLEHALSCIDLPYVELNDELENDIRRQSARWVFVGRSTGELYVDIRTKNYSSAILNLTGVLDSVFVNYHDQQRINTVLTSIKGVSQNLKASQKSANQDSKKDIRVVKKAIRKFDDDDLVSVNNRRQWLVSKGINDAQVIQWSDSVVHWKSELADIGSGWLVKKDLLKYGSFAAAVAQAQNSDEVSKAIESVALPAGSASIKKKSILNVSLNAYVGGFYGKEYLKETPGQKTAPIIGVYAPVTIAISAGLGKNGGSLSGLVTLIDVGAFASFRLQDDSTKALPEVSLQNILSPGLGIAYGIPGWPVSVGWTWQLGPMLREINGQQKNASDRPNHRWQFFVGVDIPIVNFYTRTR